MSILVEYNYKDSRGRTQTGSFKVPDEAAALKMLENRKGHSEHSTAFNIKIGGKDTAYGSIDDAIKAYQPVSEPTQAPEQAGSDRFAPNPNNTAGDPNAEHPFDRRLRLSAEARARGETYPPSNPAQGSAPSQESASIPLGATPTNAPLTTAPAQPNTVSGSSSNISGGSTGSSSILPSNPSLNRTPIPLVTGTSLSSQSTNNIINNLNDRKAQTYANNGMSFNSTLGFNMGDVFNAPAGATFKGRDGKTLTKEQILGANQFSTVGAGGFSVTNVTLAQPLANYEALIKAGVPLEMIRVEPLPAQSLSEVALPNFGDLYKSQVGNQIDPNSVQLSSGQMPDQSKTDMTSEFNQ